MHAYASEGLREPWIEKAGNRRYPWLYTIQVKVASPDNRCEKTIKKKETLKEKVFNDATAAVIYKHLRTFELIHTSTRSGLKFEIGIPGVIYNHLRTFELIHTSTRSGLKFEIGIPGAVLSYGTVNTSVPGVKSSHQSSHDPGQLTPMFTGHLTGQDQVNNGDLPNSVLRS